MRDGSRSVIASPAKSLAAGSRRGPGAAALEFGVEVNPAFRNALP